MFFRDDSGWMVYGMVLAAVIGMVIGAVTGLLTSFVLRLSVRGVQWDALLGSAGYVAATLISRGSTNHDVGMTIVTISVAALLPIFRELYRFRKKGAIKSTA
jgi:hypothetical protein